MMQFRVLKSWTALGALGAVVCGLMVGACAPSSHSSSPAATSDEAPDFTDVPVGQADQVAQSATLSCDGGCPEGLAMSLLRLDNELVSHFFQCTAFLVSPTVVATNSHCLSPGLRESGASPAGRITIIFGETSTVAAEAIPVARILSATTIDEDLKSYMNTRRPDLAFLKLAHAVKRAPFKLSRAGIADHEALTAFVVDKAGDLRHLNGFGHPVACEAVQNTILAPQFTNRLADVATARCQLILGNSGSPVMGADGFIHAIVHGIRPSSTPSKMKGYRLPERFDPMIVMTNMSCAEAPASLGLGPVSGVCRTKVPNPLELLQMLIGPAPYDTRPLYETWSAGAPSPLGFERTDLPGYGLSQGSMPQVTCIRPATEWVEKSALKLGLDSISHSKHDVVLSFTAPLWGIVPALDSSRRILPAAGERDRLHTTLSFDLEVFVKSGNARVTETITSETGVARAKPSTFDLPVCH